MGSEMCIRDRAMTTSRVGAALFGPCQELSSVSDHARLTDRSSGGLNDVLLTDIKRAEALAITAVPNVGANFTRGKEAVNWTLPSKKASSRGRIDRELALCRRVEGVGPEEAPVVAVPMKRSRASCAFAAAVTASRSSLSAAVMPRWNSRRRPLRRSVVAWASSSARRVCSAPTATSTEPSRGSQPR